MTSRTFSSVLFNTEEAVGPTQPPPLSPHPHLDTSPPSIVFLFLQDRLQDTEPRSFFRLYLLDRLRLFTVDLGRLPFEDPSRGHDSLFRTVKVIDRNTGTFTLNSEKHGVEDILSILLSLHFYFIQSYTLRIHS